MNTNKTRPLISIVTPVFNEEDSLLIYKDEVSRIFLSRDDLEFEFILIDDGSTDRSWSIIKSICNENKFFKGIRLSRNFGSHTALSAGLQKCRGDAVAILACDLQDPPEVVLQFVELWNKGFHVIWGKRNKRKDSLWKIVTSDLFKYLLRKFAIPANSKFTTGSFLLMDRKVVDWYNTFKEHNRITFAIVAWMGFTQEVVEYDRRERKIGKSGWTLLKMIKTFYDGIIGFSYMPIRLLSTMGILVSLFNVFFALYVMINWLVRDVKSGWTSMVLLISFLGGLQLLILGFITEFLYRIYIETTNRPLYCILEETK
ncbi:MAG: glycosyltransferase family 2 protein [Candidatus Hydrogenedentota bacterium]